MKLSAGVVLGLATLGGIGRLPKAPGTWASAAAAILAPLLFLPLPMPLRLGVCLGIYLVGVQAATRAEVLLQRHDPGCVVIDELLGQWIALCATASPAPWWELVLAFGLFRLLDITKPWPIRALERRIAGGHGIMLDDVVAGLMALGGLALLRVLLP
ncbi:MAG: phosphatidylglycerophosphatase [Desulfomicrobiaceae bacterium]|jgi:phosphatidylglycerophosphatase A|nr:phosphatidylglycerophosphatase A [Desulfomicrobiaceae bacterium]MDK2872618.1 phosphatidylglycerophosphatase [Desulfomicrobiaceae bacterium]